MCMVNVVISVLSFIFLWIIPESPHWLVTFKNDSQGAAKSMKWLYTDNQVFDHRYQKLLDTTKKHKSIENSPSTSKISERHHLLGLRRDYFTVYKDPVVYKPFIILLLLFLFQQLSGAYVIIFYAVNIFREIGGHFEEKGFDEYVALVLLGSIRFVCSIISSFLSKKVGRRHLLFVSGAGMCLTSLIAGVYMYLIIVPPAELAELNISKAKADDNIVLICVLGYVCFSSLGYLVIPWTLIGELLPVKVRGKLGGLLVSIAYILMFSVVKVFPFVLELLKIQCIFYIFSLVNLCSICFIFFFLPETLGKSFSDIEKYFRKDV